jgi:BlaI family transcriptional regulator, penicillinase repressor
MAPQHENVTETELAILDVLWKQGPSTIRQISEILYPKGKFSQYATVQSLLQRLESKGYVARDRSAFVHVFRAKVKRSSVIGQQLQVVADKLCEGSLAPLLLQLAEKTRLTEQQREILRKLLDDPTE